MSSIYATYAAQAEIVSQTELAIFTFQIISISIIHNALYLMVKNTCSKLLSSAQVQLPGFSVDRIV